MGKKKEITIDRVKKQKQKTVAKCTGNQCFIVPHQNPECDMSHHKALEGFLITADLRTVKCADDHCHHSQLSTLSVKTMEPRTRSLSIPSQGGTESTRPLLSANQWAESPARRCYADEKREKGDT